MNSVTWIILLVGVVVVLTSIVVIIDHTKKEKKEKVVKEEPSSKNTEEVEKLEVSDEKIQLNEANLNFKEPASRDVNVLEQEKINLTESNLDLTSFEKKENIEILSVEEEKEEIKEVQLSKMEDDEDIWKI